MITPRPDLPTAEGRLVHRGARWERPVQAAKSPSLATVSVVLGGLLSASGARAQEMEPRAYSAAPIGTNFLVGGYSRTTGSVSTDPSLPITGVQASIHTGTLAYQRTFALAGRSASAAVALPYVWADVSGEVQEQSRKVSPSGLGDLKLRFAANLLGGPALTPAEFVQRAQTTTLGTSLTIVAPMGKYDATRLINISSNRWAVRPEIGVAQPLGDWFADASAGAWVFTDNSDFFRGNLRGQEPIAVVQLHGGYNFRPGLWLAADVTYYTGGETSVNGTSGHDTQAVSRYGLTLSLPVVEGLSVKLAWSTWLTARAGGSFDTYGLALQYRWFDR
jgi:Putative MetA-pathway of phenol degradation